MRPSKLARNLITVAGITCVLLSLLVLPPGWPEHGLASAQSNGSHDVRLPIIVNGFTDLPPPIIPATTHPLTPDTMQRLVSISADGRIFTFDRATPELQALRVGHVMVGGISTLAPHGFLRTITSIASVGNQVRIETASASLEDAIEQGGFLVRRTLTPVDVQGGYMAQGVSLLSDVSPTLADSFYFEIKDVVLYDRDHNPSTTSDQVKANGSLEFAPTLEFAPVWRYRQLEYLKFALHTDEQAELEILAEAEILELKAQFLIARLHLSSIVVFIGPVPVVITIELPIYLCADGNVTVGITTSVTQQARLSAGAEYKDGAWSLIANLSNSFGFDPPMPKVGAQFKMYTEPKLWFRLYGVAGPWVAARPFVEFTADSTADPWWELFAGLEAPLGVEMEVLGRSLAKYEGIAISYRIRLACAQTSTRTPTATATPSGTLTRTPTRTPTPTPTQPPPPPNRTVDVVLIIDSSGSMTSNDPQDLRRDAAKVFIDAMQTDDQLAIVDFDSYTRVAWPLQPVTDNRSAIKTAVDTIDSSGGTNIGAGLSAAFSQLSSSPMDSSKAAVLLTDGQGSYNHEADLYAAKGWRVFTIGLGSSADAALLQAIANATGGQYYPLTNSGQLIQVYAEIQRLATEGIKIAELTSHLQQGQTVNQALTMPSGQTTANFLANWAGSRVDMTLVDPTGRTIDPNVAAADPNIDYVAGSTYAQYRVTYPLQGPWQVILYGAELPTGGEDVVTRVWARGDTISPSIVWESEAEHPSLLAPMVIGQDPNASGSAYIYSTERFYSTPGPGRATFTFSVPAQKTYYLWARVMPLGWNNNSYYVSLDGGEWVILEILEKNVPWSTWGWNEVKLFQEPIMGLPLQPGTHTLTFSGREENTRLDALILTENPNYRPEGVLQPESNP